MPCSDGQPSYGGSCWTCDDKDRTIKRMSAMLCEALSLLEQKKIKIPNLSKDWWADHKQEDQDRRLREARKAQEDKERQKVIKSLTPKQLRLLGIKQ